MDADVTDTFNALISATEEVVDAIPDEVCLCVDPAMRQLVQVLVRLRELVEENA